MGHNKCECWKLKGEWENKEKSREIVNDRNDDGAGNHLFQADQERGNTKTKQSWYVDSDATSHMTINKSLLSELSGEVTLSRRRVSAWVRQD
jgi:hypothetical protein